MNGVIAVNGEIAGGVTSTAAMEIAVIPGAEAAVAAEISEETAAAVVIEIGAMADMAMEVAATSVRVSCPSLPKAFA